MYPHSNSERVNSKHPKRFAEDFLDSITVRLALVYAFIWVDFFDPATSPLSGLQRPVTNTEEKKQTPTLNFSK